MILPTEVGSTSSDIKIAGRQHLYGQMHLNGHFYHTLEYLLFQKSPQKTAFYCNNRPGIDLLALLIALLQQDTIRY